MTLPRNRIKWTQLLWDAWCTLSIVGIWPRFIEPKLLTINRLNLPINQLPDNLIGLKIVQFSDLHWNNKIPPSFVNKLIKKINSLNPDILVFTGDFLCRSQLHNPERLKNFLNCLKSSCGSFAILGNHDYDRFVTLNQDGVYDTDYAHTSTIKQGFKRLFYSLPIQGVITEAAKGSKFHDNLLQLLGETPFQLLHNTTTLIPYKNSFLNISGLGEYSAGKLNVAETFKEYDPRYPGVVLLHNPDVVHLLKNSPGDIILAGHTHGAQINLPYLRKHLTAMEHPQYLRGLNKLDSKWVYTNRGVGSIMPFRWFSMPELTLITLQQGGS